MIRENKTEKKRLEILKILNASNKPLSSQRITEQLINMGRDISERTVRFHLLDLDKMGMTEYIGRHGRKITEKGRNELSNARVFEKVGFLAAKIDQMTYSMDFNLSKLQGSVVVNVSLVGKNQLKNVCPLITSAFQTGYAMGRLLTIYDEGEQIGELIIPDGYAGIGTVCSISLNGVLLQHGIPIISKFGGLLEIKERKPTRFIEIIAYEASSLDPLEIFIKGEMTNISGVIEKGFGRIGASFREVPVVSRAQVVEIGERLKEIGLGGFIEIGWPGQPLFEVPIIEGRIGAVVAGGLNPVARLKEYGINVQSHALSGLEEFNRLRHFKELSALIGQILS
jgi:repressor of nif and glnA expression